MILDSQTRTVADYQDFLQRKIRVESQRGFEVPELEVNPTLKDFNRDIVRWALRGGRRAIFAAFGLHKTAMQLEIMRLIGDRDYQHAMKTGMRLIVLPLGVRQEFIRDAINLFKGQYAVRTRFIRRLGETTDDRTIYLTNYESVREGILDISPFEAVSLDEASVLRGFGGTKTFREFMRLFEGNPVCKYKFVATATPSPNEYIELLAYAAFLEVMDVGQAKTRFFKRDSTKADQLTLHAHKEREFWLWVSTWAIFLQKPSDLGYSDEGYELPAMDVHWHEVATDHSDAGIEKSGQKRLLQNAAIGVSAAAREKRNSLGARVAKLMELRALDPFAHRLIWHDLEAERHAIQEAIPEVASVYGSQDLEEREDLIIDFSEGRIPELSTKPEIAGSGCNFQRHCAWEIFAGIGFKFNDFIQAIHRVQRFGQTKRVRVDMIYTEAERNIRETLQRKWDQHNELVAQMTGIIREYGLASHVADELQRSIGVERQEFYRENFSAINNDAVLETFSMSAESVHLILTSIPFSTQYEYTPSYNDFGHTDSNQHFWEQMDFLTPNLLRILKPGRVAAIHVKDRIVPGGLTGLGFQTVYPFHADSIAHFQKHGFAFLGMKTIVTDVVRENNQTYRLGWTEQCKDGSRMGCGMPEYLLLFRKPPTDSSNGYADDPVVKDKAEYSRARWQVDAHGFMRSSGERLLSSADFKHLKHDEIFRLFRAHSMSQVYDYENHVNLGEELDACQACGHLHTGDKRCALCECKEVPGILPRTFMLLQPQSWHPDVWSDVTRMLSLNGAQSAAGREMHLCPMQFDIADRVIRQFSMEGEIVFDPFAGLMTVPLRAMKLKRKGWGVELNPNYFRDGVYYLEAAEKEMSMPTLFDMETPHDQVPDWDIWKPVAP